MPLSLHLAQVRTKGEDAFHYHRAHEAHRYLEAAERDARGGASTALVSALPAPLNLAVAAARLVAYCAGFFADERKESPSHRRLADAARALVRELELALFTLACGALALAATLVAGAGAVAAAVLGEVLFLPYCAAIEASVHARGGRVGLGLDRELREMLRRADAPGAAGAAADATRARRAYACLKAWLELCPLTVALASACRFVGVCVAFASALLALLPVAFVALGATVPYAAALWARRIARVARVACCAPAAGADGRPSEAPRGAGLAGADDEPRRADVSLIRAEDVEACLRPGSKQRAREGAQQTQQMRRIKQVRAFVQNHENKSSNA